MPLPSDFSHVEHVQDVVRRVLNREVREFFKDVGPESWEPDLSSARASLRVACTHEDADSVQLTLLRILIYFFAIGEVRGLIPELGRGDNRDLNYRVLRRTKPVVTLHFQENLDEVEPGYDPVLGEISFRLMNESMTTMTVTEATALGQRIKASFGSAGGFVWKKGKEMYSYSDWDRGYQLQLLCRTEAEAKRVIEQVLDVQGHTPDWEYMGKTVSAAPAEAYPTIPPTETILGQRVKLPRRRPIANVRFQYAKLKMPGLPKPHVLYDRTGRFRDAYVKP